MHLFSSGKPIATNDQDKLTRGIFSKRLADALMNYQSSDCFVVGLYGQWGSGKSSVLNLMKNQLAQRSKPEKPIVMEFQPWITSHREDLVSDFLIQFATVMKAPNTSGALNERAQQGLPSCVRRSSE